MFGPDLRRQHRTDKDEEREQEFVKLATNVCEEERERRRRRRRTHQSINALLAINLSDLLHEVVGD